MNGTINIEGLPGAELIARGLEDCVKGRESVESLLVQIGWPRLQAAGVVHATQEPPLERGGPDAELRLYELLVQRHGRAAYTQYQALLRRLVSFENAADQRWRRTAEEPAGADA
jgi:hypothetical protein